MIYQEIDSKKHFATLPPIHVAHPQYWRKGVYTEAWLSEEDQSCNPNQAFWEKRVHYIIKYFLSFICFIDVLLKLSWQSHPRRPLKKNWRPSAFVLSQKTKANH